MTKTYLPVQPLTFVPNFQVGVDVFSCDQRRQSFTKILEANQLLTQEKQNQLAMREEQNSYILGESSKLYREMLTKNLDPSSAHGTVSDLSKLAMICESCRLQLSDGLETQSVSRWIEMTYSTAKEFDRLVKSGLDSKLDRLDRTILFVLWKEGSFLNHAFNVGFYSYLLAYQLQKKIHPDLDPIECMVGGFLHDIGKLLVDKENKDLFILPTGLLANHQMRRQDPHPMAGYHLLVNHPAITKLPLLACYQHHERHNGKGFPVGLISDQIPIASSICAVANRWDGMMTDRKASKAISRANAIQTINSEKSLYWNAEIVQCLTKLMN